MNIQVFTTAGSTLTYIPSPGLITAVVECIGGGGGGGSAGPTGTATEVFAGGGGGSGGYSRKVLNAALVLGGVNVTVGAGGASMAAGGATSFGALCVANGGGPGGSNNTGSGQLGSPGAGASAGVGDVVFVGSFGTMGMTQVNVPAGMWEAAPGGRGGEILGGATSFPVAPGAIGGSAGVNPSGAGGSGAVVNQNMTSNTYPGGSGASGICIVTEYCSGDAGCPPGCAPVPSVGWDGSCC